MQSDNQIEIVPLELEKAKIPLFLRGFQTISFCEGYDIGFHSLAHHLGVGDQIDSIGIEESPHTESAPIDSSAAKAPPHPSEPGVFIAYDIRDRDYAQRVAEFLQANGVRRWMAPGDIQVGAKWEVALVDAVLNSKAILVVMTPNSSRSRWVEEEVRIAIREGIPIFPILLAGEPFDSLRGVQYFDARHQEMPPRQLIEQFRLTRHRSA